MIVEYLRYAIDPPRQAAFIEAYAQAKTVLLESEYALGFEMCQCVEDASQFIIRIGWTSAEDHLKLFRSSPGFALFFSHVRPYFNDILEMRHYQPVLNEEG